MRRLGPGRRDDEVDPLASLANLFDIGIIFGVGVLTLASDGALDGPDAPTAPLERYRAVPDRRLEGEGTRLGVAFRLPNGEVVYVPDPAESEPASRPERP